MLKLATLAALGIACASASVRPGTCDASLAAMKPTPATPAPPPRVPQVPSVPQSHSRHDATVVRLDNGDTKTATGPTYDDLPNNRTRYEMKEQPGLVIIELYKLGKEFGLQDGQCQFCPLSFTQYPFGPSGDSASLGQLKVDDVLCNGCAAAAPRVCTPTRPRFTARRSQLPGQHVLWLDGDAHRQLVDGRGR